MANTDLQQRNETPYFAPTADVNTNTDPYLVPTDGKIISAQNNGTDEAPILPVLLKIRGTLAGLRGAIIGDFAGAVMYTVKKLYADSVGGSSTFAPGQNDGDIYALNDIVARAGDIKSIAGAATIQQTITSLVGNIAANVGDMIATLGNIKALAVGAKVQVGPDANQRLEHLSPYLRWVDTSTGGGDANPPGATALPNQLRALNVPKAFASITTNMGGAVVINASASIASVTVDASKFTITFATAFNSANWSVATNVVEDRIHNVTIRNKTATTCEVWVYDSAGYVNPGLIQTPSSVDLVFFGRQDT